MLRASSIIETLNVPSDIVRTTSVLSFSYVYNNLTTYYIILFVLWFYILIFLFYET
jgi:hypothetical protein